MPTPVTTPIPTGRPGRRNRGEQPNLFLRPTDLPPWDQLPGPCRQEVRRLIAEMFVAHVLAARAATGASLTPDREADHE